jgi:hypothetical protein
MINLIDLMDSLVLPEWIEVDYVDRQLQPDQILSAYQSSIGSSLEIAARIGANKDLSEDFHQKILAGDDSLAQLLSDSERDQLIACLADHLNLSPDVAASMLDNAMSAVFAGLSDITQRDGLDAGGLWRVLDENRMTIRGKIPPELLACIDGIILGTRQVGIYQMPHKAAATAMMEESAESGRVETSMMGYEAEKVGIYDLPSGNEGPVPVGVRDEASAEIQEMVGIYELPESAVASSPVETPADQSLSVTNVTDQTGPSLVGDYQAPIVEMVGDYEIPPLTSDQEAVEPAKPKAKKTRKTTQPVEQVVVEAAEISQMGDALVEPAGRTMEPISPVEVVESAAEFVGDYEQIPSPVELEAAPLPPAGEPDTPIATRTEAVTEDTSRRWLWLLLGLALLLGLIIILTRACTTNTAAATSVPARTTSWGVVSSDFCAGGEERSAGCLP